MRSSGATAGHTGGSADYNNLFKDAQAAGYLLPHQMQGTLALPTNPSNNQTVTITINGTAVVATFVTAIGTTANNIFIGSTAAITAANFLAWLQNAHANSPTQVAASLAQQNLLSDLSFSLNGTNLVLSSPNNTTTTPLTSLSVSTTVTGGSWTANTMALYVEPGIYNLGNAQPLVFAGGASPNFTAPVSHPRIDILTIDGSGTLAITQGSENVSPVAPSYPYNKIVLCEVYNVVGETKILDNDNQAGGQGYIFKDSRCLFTDVYFNNANQFGTGVISDASFVNTFVHLGGSVNESVTGVKTFGSLPIMPGDPSAGNDMCNKNYAVNTI